MRFLVVVFINTHQREFASAVVPVEQITAIVDATDAREAAERALEPIHFEANDRRTIEHVDVYQVTGERVRLHAKRVPAWAIAE